MCSAITLYIKHLVVLNYMYIHAYKVNGYQSFVWFDLEEVHTCRCKKDRIFSFLQTSSHCLGKTNTCSKQKRFLWCRAFTTKFTKLFWRGHWWSWVQYHCEFKACWSGDNFFFWKQTIFVNQIGSYLPKVYCASFSFLHIFYNLHFFCQNSSDDLTFCSGDLSGSVKREHTKMTLTTTCLMKMERKSMWTVLYHQPIQLMVLLRIMYQWDLKSRRLWLLRRF